MNTKQKIERVCTAATCYVIVIISCFFTDGTDGANKASSERKCVNQMNETEEAR